MKGGYQILDLRNIGISYSSETKNITDPEILDQLRNLREYIEKGHNYSSALNNSLKCVMIRYRDAKVSEKWEECEFATINSSNASLTYEIKGKELRIEVVFEEKQDDDGNSYYDIKTAKYLYNQNAIIGGDLTVGGDTSFEGDISVGAESNVKVFENIVDKDGHKRFIEGDITINQMSGVTQNYGKWSLSGSHLLIVLALTLQNETTILDNAVLCDINVPSWVLNKIYGFVGATVDYKTFGAYATTGGSQNFVCRLHKTTTPKLQIRKDSNLTLTNARYVRIAFDLLIDNEVQA